MAQMTKGSRFHFEVEVLPLLQMMSIENFQEIVHASPLTKMRREMQISICQIRQWHGLAG